jgi:hypothetical protein
MRSECRIPRRRPPSDSIHHDGTPVVVLAANRHRDLHMCDDEVVTNGPDVSKSLAESAAGDLVEHPGQVAEKLISAAEVSNEIGDGRLKVPHHALVEGVRIVVEPSTNQLDVG